MRDFPISFHGNHGHGKSFGYLGLLKAAKEAQFHNARGARIGAGEFGERLIKVK